MNINLQEIFSCNEWVIEPIAGKQLYNALMAAIASHQNDTDSEGMKKTEGFYLSKQKSEQCGKLYVGDIHRIENKLYWRDEELAEDDQIINCVVIEGAITRNGGACTYGSKDHREQIMYANTIPQVIGHIFFINTPGGMVSAMPDYTQAIENCREMGKPTVGKIDGSCDSGGVWIACQLDYIIATNREDRIGCIGGMCCGELAPHGAVNTVTQERTFILIGKGSPDKNREVMEASQGNDEMLQQRADEITEEFHKLVKENRPAVTDDLLTGKIYPAHEVMGKLVDEIGDTARAIEAVFQLADGTLKPAREMEVVPSRAEDARRHEMEDDEDDEATNIKPQNENDMTEQEKKAAEAEAAEAAKKQEEAAAAAEEGTGEGAGDGAGEGSGEGTGEGAQQGAGEGTGDQNSEKSIEDAQEEIDRITETLHNAEAMVEAKDKEIDEMQSTIATKSEAFDTLQKAFDEQGKTLAESQALVTERDTTIAELKEANEKLTKQVAELKAEVKELSEKPAPMVDGQAGVPAGNGTGDAPKYEGAVKSEISSDMSVEEIRERLRQKDEKQKTWRH